MTPDEFKARTKNFAKCVVRFIAAQPQGGASSILMRQLLRAATSVGANYRAACRSRSTADMIAKLKIVEEECDESMYWLEILREVELVEESRTDALLDEAGQILAMTVSSIKTLRQRQQIQAAKDRAGTPSRSTGRSIG